MIININPQCIISSIQVQYPGKRTFKFLPIPSKANSVVDKSPSPSTLDPMIVDHVCDNIFCEHTFCSCPDRPVKLPSPLQSKPKAATKFGKVRKAENFTVAKIQVAYYENPSFSKLRLVIPREIDNITDISLLLSVMGKHINEVVPTFQLQRDFLSGQPARKLHVSNICFHKTSKNLINEIKQQLVATSPRIVID